MTDTRLHILKTLAYFDIFQYPLRVEEIQLFHGQNSRIEIINEGIRSLTADKIIFRIDEFYSLHDDISLTAGRRQGNELANEQMKTVHKAAKILSWFPYVRGLAISGSLSKNFANNKTDIDFFIITSANRLWIARTCMHLFKKITFLAGRQHWFCMNYYVDGTALEIEEKNVYTAMEIITLLPMFGKVALQDFLNANKWVKDHFPCSSTLVTETAILKDGFFKRVFEKIFNNNMGEWLDNLLMKITDKRWKKKLVKNLKNGKGLAKGMLVSKHYSKPDPVNFQDKIVLQYENRVKLLVEEERVAFRV